MVPPSTAVSPTVETTEAATDTAHGIQRGQSDGWWRDAVIYQVYPRSFADSDGDGIGDVPGITARLDHLADLGVDAVWLSPFYTSPQVDMGYDVADYLNVDPTYGTLADFDAMIARAHTLGLKVIIDIVPNHCSSAHPRFQQALAAGPGSPERDWFIFRDGRGDDGSLPPNNWGGSDQGSAWTRVVGADGTPEQWYLHLFDKEQPDWDWTYPPVADMFDEVLRFWLDRGADGFRVDVSHGMIKQDGLPDYEPVPYVSVIPTLDPATRPPMWDQDGVHEIHRRWRRILNEYDDRILVAEAWLVPERNRLYVRADEMHQSFNFGYLITPWVAAELKQAIDAALASDALVGAPTTWVLSNHDVIRHASRLGFAPDVQLPNGIGAEDDQPDRELGLRRARAATALMLSLPGSAYIYQGEELGLAEVTDLPDEALTDYIFFFTQGKERGRDGCRVPIPWHSDAPSFGFGPSPKSWLPQPEWFSDYAVDVQDGVSDSTLELYRLALRLRRQHRLGSGTVQWREAPAGALVLARGAITVIVNTTSEILTVPVTPGSQVVLDSTGAGHADAVGDAVDLPADSTWWLSPPS